MATYSSAKVAAGTPAKSLRVGLTAVTATFSVAAAGSLVTGDIIQMINVPKGATVIYLAVSGGSGDALAAVGDQVSDGRYLAYQTMGSSLPNVKTIALHANNVPYVYSTDDTIDITISTVSVATITGGFHMTAIFSMDTA